MKIRLVRLAIWLPLLLLFAALGDASAFYNPQLQRWINRDPLGEEGGMNLYAFVGNNPIGFADYEGLSFVGDWWCALFPQAAGCPGGPEPDPDHPGGVRMPNSGPTLCMVQGGPNFGRGRTGHPSRTQNPFKHMRQHPTKPNKVIYKDPQTGKTIEKPKPPGFPGRS
jgi:hypothetical protein